MANRTHAENLQLILNALRHAGESGLSVEELKAHEFNDCNLSKTDIKKFLDTLKSKGFIHVKVGKIDIRYTIIPGH